MLDGLQLAKGRAILSLWLEVDSLLLVNMLQGLCEVPWHIHYIFKEIKAFLPPKLRHTHTHIYREGNQGEDFMANMGINTHVDHYFENIDALPKQVKGIIRLDRSGLPCVRLK